MTRVPREAAPAGSGGHFGPVLFCGDPHGRFDHIVDAAIDPAVGACAVVLLGDLQPRRMLHVELAPIVGRGLPLWFIHGNHDTDSEADWLHVWGSGLADRNVHGRVVDLPNGLRLAGLGGIFRESVWHPAAGSLRRGEPAFRTRAEHRARTPRHERWHDGVARRDWSSIYPEDVDRLAELRADILVTHEASGCHPYGFDLIDTLLQSMGARISVHGHHHDCLDTSSVWDAQGFRSFGVGLRGITAIDADGAATIIRPGELDRQRGARSRLAGAMAG